MGWVGVFIVLVVVAWKPTTTYLTSVNTAKMNQFELVLNSLQTEVKSLRVELARAKEECRLERVQLNKEIRKWRDKYYAILTKIKD